MSKNLNLFETSITPFISIDNLFNKEYFDNIRINAFGSRFYEPAPGINFIGGLKLNL
jgi:iron complex outermembrane receptor protein